MIDLTGENTRGRGYIEAASMDGSDVTITGDPGDLPDDVDSILSDLLADHDVGHYPSGAVIGWFATDRLTDGVVRDPAEVEADPYPFDNV